MKPVKNTALRLPETTEEYIQAELACGLRHGDLVKVVRKAQTHEHGWMNAWILEMDAYVGKSYRINQLGFPRMTGGNGIRVEDFYFPYFVLEPIYVG